MPIKLKRDEFVAGHKAIVTTVMRPSPTEQLDKLMQRLPPLVPPPSPTPKTKTGYTVSAPRDAVPDFDDNGPLAIDDWSLNPKLATLPHFPELISEYESARLRSKEAEEERNRLAGDIKTTLQLVGMKPSEKVLVGRLSVCYTANVRKTFNKKKAVLLGLPADILDACYDTTEVQTLRIDEVKNSGE